uniref:Uncharacterized protein n=1 Tax=Arundo donax TaxID=35708 RepID=A0A0A9GHE6_ARUDO
MLVLALLDWSEREDRSSWWRRMGRRAAWRRRGSAHAGWGTGDRSVVGSLN